MSCTAIGRAGKIWLETGPNPSSSSVSSQVFIIGIGTAIHSPLREGSQELIPFSGTQKGHYGMTEVTAEEKEVRQYCSKKCGLWVRLGVGILPDPREAQLSLFPMALVDQSVPLCSVSSPVKWE